MASNPVLSILPWINRLSKPVALNQHSTMVKEFEPKPNSWIRENSWRDSAKNSSIAYTQLIVENKTTFFFGHLIKQFPRNVGMPRTAMHVVVEEWMLMEGSPERDEGVQCKDESNIDNI